MIKYLTPRSEEELRSSFKKLTPEEKIEFGCVENIPWLVKDAIKEGANVNPRKYYFLTTACRDGHKELAEILLDAGANFNGHEKASLRLAVIQGYTEIVKLLIDRGMDIKEVEGSPLYVACIHGYVEIVKLLINAGASIQSLYYATVIHSNPEIQKIILEKFKVDDKVFNTEI